MAHEFLRTFIAKMRGTNDWSWEDELWVVQGDWDDLEAALRDAHGWVAAMNAEHPEYEQGLKLPEGKAITLVVGYPPSARVSLTGESTLLAEAKTLSDVVTFSVVREPGPEGVAALATEEVTQNRVTVTLIPERRIAFAHFPVDEDIAAHPRLLVALARDPQLLVTALRASTVTWREATGRALPEDLPRQPDGVDFADVTAENISHFRMLLQTGCTPPTAGILTCNPACCTVMYTMVPALEEGATRLVMNTFLYTCYWVCPPPPPG